MVKVFLVEYESIIRHGIRDNIDWASHGFEFAGEAGDGEYAYPLILKAQPDILVTDIKMPFMDGLELARIVRKELPDTRIIILSGHNEFEYARKAITLGVNDYLLKPVSSRDILEAVDRSKAQILECRARRIERQSHSITQRDLSPCGVVGIVADEAPFLLHHDDVQSRQPFAEVFQALRVGQAR